MVSARMVKSVIIFFFLGLFILDAQALDFLNSEQKAVRTMQQGVSFYRAQQFQQAVEQFSMIKTADGFYNKGNALAQLNNIDAAIEAYEEALKIDPQHKDAAYNRDLLKKLKPPKNNNQPPPPPQQQQQPESQEKRFWQSVDEDPGSLLKQKFLRDYLKERGR